MLQRLGIRGKLLAVVAVPMIVLLLAAAFVVWNAAVEQTTSRNTAHLVDAVQSASSLIEDVQDERGNASNYLRTISDGDAKRITARTAVNTTVAALGKAAEDDPSLASWVEAVVAAVNGAGGESGVETYREIAVVDSVEGNFPAWPDAESVDIAVAGFARIADEVDAAVVGAPVSDVGTQLRELADLIRTEGDETGTYLNDAREYSEALPQYFTQVDTSAAGFLSTANSVGDRADNVGVLRYIDDLRTRLPALEALRDRVRAGDVLPGNADVEYSAVVTDLLEMTRDVANSVPDRELASYLGAYASMEELFEAVRLEEEYVARKIREGYWIIGELSRFQGLYFGSNNALENVRLAVEPLAGIPAVPEFGASYSLSERIGFESIRDRLLADDSNEALTDQRSANWEVQVSEELEVMAPIRATIFDAVQSGTADLSRNSLVQLIATIAIAGLVFALSMFITLSMARRIINPLRRLTTTATAVRQELPRLVERVALPGQAVDVSEVQIPVESQDEVGRLAEAFNSVNAATLSIAAEQAALRGSISEMFVNVARRDQVLLNRQLSSIDEMERTEDNQTTLTKLFALDHLATRMRRNSESLLVLAGIDTGRRLRRPMPLSDVIRTASSEIELYERVQLELDADPSMLGHSALTAAHLFAELLENATVFSDPGSPVVVRTIQQGDNVVVEVIDSGIGMTQEELGEANSRVASTAASEILGAQRLGLFVVGRIARRVGARVQLDSSEGKGTVATVVMPPSLFDTSEVQGAGHVSDNATDATTHAPRALVQHSVADAEVTEPVADHISRPAAVPLGYQPTTIEQGSDLLGRAPEVGEVQEASLGSAELTQLVAADAAAAPEPVAVNLDELTSGVTPSGLPTRRRKASEDGPEAPQETNNIIGLPMRASDEQLTALETATTSGFTPILAADEVSPESAEQRARVFRGFRPRHAGDGDEAVAAPDAESLGHALRRGAPAADVPPPEAQTSSSFPSLEPIAMPVRVPAPEVEVEIEVAAEAEIEVEVLAEAPPEPSAVFAVEAADPRHQSDPVVRQSPLIATGYTNDEIATPAEYSAPAHEFASEPALSMSIPLLEEEEAPPARPVTASVPTVVADTPRASAPSPEPQWPATTLGGAGVDQVSLDDLVAPTAEHPAPVYRSALYPAASNDWNAAPQQDPVTTTPSLDDLIMDGSHSADADARGGFFSRMFGRSRKTYAPQASRPSTVDRPVVPDVTPLPTAPFAPLGEGVPESRPAWQAQEPAPAPAQPPAPAPAPAQQPMARREPDAGFVPNSAYLGEAAPPAQPAPVVHRAAPEAPVVAEDRSMWIRNQVVAPSPAPEVPTASDPALSDGGWGAAESMPWGGTQYAVPDNSAAYAAPGAYKSGGDSGPAMFAPADGHGMYSPDQLARPLGWEAAGESALQAAAPEVATEYRPVVQIETQESSEGTGDFASDVFSELSSLAAERPKLEKTRAGLVKRTPVEKVEEEGPTVDVATPAVPRDAESVRNRFSSFYSGTQRARDDVKNFNDSTQGSFRES